MPRPKPTITPAAMPLRVPPDVKERLAVLATLTNRSLNQTCVDLFEAALRERKL